MSKSEELNPKLGEDAILVDEALQVCQFCKHHNLDMPKSNHDNTKENTKRIGDFEQRKKEAEAAETATGEKAKKRLADRSLPLLRGHCEGVANSTCSPCQLCSFYSIRDSSERI